jgi:hypothetical protein
MPGAPGGFGAPGAPGGFGAPGAPGTPGAPGIPEALPGIAALSSSSVAPQFGHSFAYGGHFAPHLGQVMSTSIAASLKHIVPSSKVYDGLTHRLPYAPCHARPPAPPVTLSRGILDVFYHLTSPPVSHRRGRHLCRSNT